MSLAIPVRHRPL